MVVEFSLWSSLTCLWRVCVDHARDGVMSWSTFWHDITSCVFMLWEYKHFAVQQKCPLVQWIVGVYGLDSNDFNPVWPLRTSRLGKVCVVGLLSSPWLPWPGPELMWVKSQADEQSSVFISADGTVSCRTRNSSCSLTTWSVCSVPALTNITRPLDRTLLHTVL